MRPGNNNRRGRNRGQRKPHGGIPNKNQNYDGGGGETRVRGNVYQILEKYLQLARDAGVSGDRIAAENYLQHADHYYRVIQAMNDGQRPRVGGRDISVADFNVQNVSQGLSAALYTGGQAPQPNISEGSPSGAGAGGNPGNGSAQGNAAGAGEGAEASGDGDDGDFNRHPGRNPRNRHQNRHDSRNGQYNGQSSNSSAGEQNSQAGAGENTSGNDAAPSGQSAPIRTVGDEQPEYPEDLLPATQSPAGGGPRDANVAAEGAREDGERGPRGRGRLRTRRPRNASETPAEPALPVVEGSE